MLARAIQRALAQISPVACTSAWQGPWEIVVAGGSHWLGKPQAVALHVLPAPQSAFLVQVVEALLLQTFTAHEPVSFMSPYVRVWTFGSVLYGSIRFPFCLLYTS